jgi:hypothetical protein
VGHDDQTWDLSLDFAVETLDRIVREVEICVRDGN